MSGPDPTSPTPGEPRFRALRSLLHGRRRRWVGAILAVNLVAVLVLAGIGSARVKDSCGGGSGYSGGGSSCQADLSVRQYAAPSPVHRFQQLIFLITVSNLGPDETFEATVTGSVSKGLPIEWGMASRSGYCDFENFVVTCHFYEIPAGGSVAASIVVRPVVAGRATDLATVTSFFPDPNPANNQRRTGVTVLP